MTRARFELNEYLRNHGYDETPGLNVVCRRTDHFTYDDVNEAKSTRKNGDKPCVMYRKKNCEWLAILPLKDFLEIYECWERNTASMMGLPFTEE